MPSESGLPEDLPPEPITIAVLGSCITRDNFNTMFNPDYKTWYRTVLMQNQSALISVMSPPTPITPEEIGEGTDYDKWNVRTDFSKEFLDELGSLQPDYLILDFFGDIHFGCLELAEGRFVTNNRWKLWPTPFYQALREPGPPPRTLRIDRNTDEYLARWKAAFDRLAEHVRRVAPGTTPVVHFGHNTTLLTLSDTAEPVPLQEHRTLAKIDLPRLNGLWRELDEYAVASTGWASIDLTDRAYPTFDGHPWGPYYVHYAMDYYRDFLTALNALHLRKVVSGLEPNVPAMVDQVLGRSREGSERPPPPGREVDDAPAAVGAPLLDELKRHTPRPVRRLARSAVETVRGLRRA
jgi:hypothetical protein